MYILSETTRHGLTPIGRGFCVAAIVCLIVFIFSIFYDSYPLLITSFIIAVILIIASFTLFTEPYQQLKATLSDDYSAVKLYEEYDVVGHDGEIWILNEKF